MGKLRKAFINYCRTPRAISATLTAKTPTPLTRRSLTVRLWISASIAASAVALWGEPRAVLATASLLDSGVDARGTVVLSYGDFDVTLHHSKLAIPRSPVKFRAKTAR